MVADSILIQRSNVSGIMEAPEFDDLIAEYAAEAAIDGMPPPKAKLEQYYAYEKMGFFHAFTAERDGMLIGFITVVAPPNAHYGVPLAVTESFFVAAAHRAGGAGLKLLDVAERCARHLGSPMLLVSAPVEGQLCKVLPKCGYTETNRIYAKRLYDA